MTDIAAHKAVAVAAAAKAGLDLVACGQRDGQTTFNLVDNRGKRKHRVHVGLTFDEVLEVLRPAQLDEPAADVEDGAEPAEDAGVALAAAVEVAPVSGVVIVDMGATEAREITDQIRAGLEQTRALIERAYLQRAWLALGHASWDDYCAAEFGTDRLRIPRHERPQVVTMLREAGLSIRAIVAATGDSVGTVHRAIEAGELFHNGTPEPVTGTDGKTYLAKKPAPAAGPLEKKPEPALAADAEPEPVDAEPLEKESEPEPAGAEPLMKTWHLTYRCDGTAEMAVEFYDEFHDRWEFYDYDGKAGGAWAAGITPSVAADLACHLKAAIPQIVNLGAHLGRRGREGES